METFSPILILLGAYALMLMLIAVINRVRPAIAAYHSVKQNDLAPLNILHMGCMLIMILPAALRVIFLVAYEWFFRGLLLFGLCEWLGTAPGIAANTLLYTLAHFHKTRKEMFGCFPFGALLCLFTLWWQSIWPAIIFHLQIAIINEWPPLRQFISPQKQTAL